MRNFLVLFLFLPLFSQANITIASGSPLGHYHTLAFERCKYFQETEGGLCEVKQTSGTVENINLLKDKKVDYAIIQSNLKPNDFKTEIILATEEFYIFYKNLPREPEDFQDLMLMVGNQYSIDKKSGSYAVFEKVMSTFNLEIKGWERTLASKTELFCERDTRLSIYMVAKESLAFKQLSLCGKFYKFSPVETDALASKFWLENGLVVNDVLLVSSLVN